MYKHILATGGDINWMALFALLTFFFIFTISIIWGFAKNKAYINRMANMPLDDQTITQQNETDYEK